MLILAHILLLIINNKCIVEKVCNLWNKCLFSGTISTKPVRVALLTLPKIKQKEKDLKNYLNTNSKN